MISEAQTREPVVPPGSNPPWLSTTVSFSGTTLHYAGESWYSEPGADYPTNEKTVLSDTWVEFDTDGVIVRLHERHTLADGTFLQESIWNGGEGAMVNSSEAEMLSDPAGNCIRRTSQADPPPARHYIPPFAVSQDMLESLGFERVTNEVIAFPETYSLQGVQSVQSFGVADPVDTWERRTVDEDHVSTLRLVTSVDGRVLWSSIHVTDNNGKILAEQQSVRGPLYVYASNSVPSSVFMPVDPTTEPCS